MLCRFFEGCAWRKSTVNLCGCVSISLHKRLKLNPHAQCMDKKRRVGYFSAKTFRSDLSGS